MIPILCVTLGFPGITCTALALGGVSAGPPGHRPHDGPHFHAADVRDYHGNKPVRICHTWNATA